MPAPAIHAMSEQFKQSDYFGPNTPRWDALESDPRATLVKSGRRRKIWRVVLPQGQGVYAKIFDDPVGSPILWCKRTLRLHPAMREWYALKRLQSLGVPAVRPIAIARYGPSIDVESRERGGIPAYRLVLLTEGIENATILVASWNAVSGPSANRCRSSKARLLAAAVAELWARSHQRGYTHPDGHPGNILIENDGSSEHAVRRAVFIDPAQSAFSTVRQKPVSAKRALVSLVMLDQYFHRSATRAERLRFWRDYWVRRDILLDGRAERRLLHRLAECAAMHRAALARQRDRRLRGDGKYFGRLQLPDGWKATVVLQLERRHVFCEAEVPDHSIEQWASLCLHILRVRHVPALEAKGIRLMRRPENHRGPWAAGLFRQAHRLRHRDIVAPLILGYLQYRSLFGIRDEYLILPAGPSLQTP